MVETPRLPGEGKFVDVPEADETPPTEVGALKMKRVLLSRIPFDAPAAIPRL